MLSSGKIVTHGELNDLSNLISIQSNTRLPGSKKNSLDTVSIHSDLWEVVNNLSKK